MGKTKVLLIDDEYDFQELMSIRMSGWGYDVIKASDGKEAIDLLLKENPDIIILDYIMPDMDGLEVLKKIRELNKNIPVIMFTAHPDTKSFEGSDTLGIAAFIPKLSAYEDAQSSLKTALNLALKKPAC